MSGNQQQSAHFHHPSADSSPSSNHHNSNSNNQYYSHQQSSPNVRHIPIFVEGRDEPLINRSNDANPPPSVHRNASFGSRFAPGGAMGGLLSSQQQPNVNEQPQQQQQQQQQQQHEQPQPTASKPSEQPAAGGDSSPNAKNPAKGASSANGHVPQQQQHQQQTQQQPKQPAPAQPMPTSSYGGGYSASSAADDATLSKIHHIQSEVLELMDKVERYKGSSRKDRDYMYLDEMLTQNLLKLDTINTDGKETIKLARREAIKCINGCISVLEAKATAFEAKEKEAQQPAPPAAGQNNNNKKKKNNASRV